ncbi:MAG: hypothetical protein ACREH5_00145 [Candidatus Omnitrophota bacterium]
MRDSGGGSDTRNPAAVVLGRLGGAKGGKARAANLSPERRTEIARMAARKRWDQEKQGFVRKTMGTRALAPEVVEKIKSTFERIKQANPPETPPYRLAKVVVQELSIENVKCSIPSVYRYAMPDIFAKWSNGGHGSNETVKAKRKKRSLKKSSPSSEQFVLASHLTQVMISGDEEHFRFEIIGATVRDVADTFREWAETRFVKVK